MHKEIPTSLLYAGTSFSELIVTYRGYYYYRYSESVQMATALLVASATGRAN